MRAEALPAALLLDTCALIWFANNNPLHQAAVEAIRHASTASGVFVSPISAWEIGLLSRPKAGRADMLQFLPNAKEWFTRVMAGPGVKTAVLTPDIAIEASFLPGQFARDPGDRLLIATARRIGVPIVTRDRRIADYAAQGHVQMIRC
jgi:PIN domain nuclease of toxin-antitoxin system